MRDAPPFGEGDMGMVETVASALVVPLSVAVALGLGARGWRPRFDLIIVILPLILVVTKTLHVLPMIWNLLMAAAVLMVDQRRQQDTLATARGFRCATSIATGSAEIKFKFRYSAT